MAEAVAKAMAEGEHLLVQAGTGTGKSLAYLVPSLLHDTRVVVATATLALQHQLVERDIPRLVEAVGDRLDASYAVLKGRSNYACLHRVREGVPDDQGVLVDVPAGSMGAEVLELRAWAEKESERGGTGERDHAPAAHRPDVAPGQRQPPRVPGRGPLRLRPGVLRGAGQGEGGPVPPDRHQPLAARDRRDRGRADDPGVRRGGHRRGARADRAGHPGGHRRAERGRRRAGGPPGLTLRRGPDQHLPPGRRPGRRCRGARRRAGDDPRRADRLRERAAQRRARAGPRRRTRGGLGVRQGGQGRQGRRRRPHPGQGPGPGGLRHRRADGRGQRRRRAVAQRGPGADARPGWRWRRCRCGRRCGTGCSPTRRWSSPPPP